MLARGSLLATVKADHGGDAMVTAGHARVLADFFEHAHLSQGVVPSARLEEQLPQAALRLGAPDHEARPAGKTLRLAGRGKSSLVLVEVTQCDRLVDLEQQPQVGQGGICLGDRERPVEQGERIGHSSLHHRFEDQHMERPADSPVIGGLGSLLEGSGRHLARHLHLAEVPVRAGDGHQQPSPVPG